MAASGEHDARLWARQVRDQLACGAVGGRPDGDVQLDGISVGAVLARAAAGLAPARLEPRPRPQGREVAQPRVGDEHDVTAAAAVPSVGPALRHVLLATEGEAAVAAAARQRLDAGAVVKHGSSLRRMSVRGGVLIARKSLKGARPATRGLTTLGLVGSLGDRDEALLAAARELDRARADGEDRVVTTDVRPGARVEAGAAAAMIIPGLTCWPAKIFTPSRFAFESRPFLDEPRPFL